MKPEEERIEAILTALRDAEPSADLHARVHAALRTADETNAPRWSWMRRAAFPVSALALVAICALAAILLLHPGTHAPRQVATIAVHHHQTPKPAPEVVTKAAVTSIQPRSHFVPAHQTKERPKVLSSEQNIPPPPLPLTHQELLLIQMAHRHKPQQLALLVADARELTFQREKEQVQEFFKPPPLPAADLSEISTDPTGGNE